MQRDMPSGCSDTKILPDNVVLWGSKKNLEKPVWFSVCGVSERVLDPSQHADPISANLFLPDRHCPTAILRIAIG